MSTSPFRQQPWWRRRWIRFALLGGALLGGLVLGLPALLSSVPGRTWIIGRINRVLAPGFLQVDGLELSWWGATRLQRVRLLDPQGAEVVKTPTATLDRSLSHLLGGGLSGASLTLEAADLDIERRADGSVNLGRALSAVIEHPDPARDLTIRVVQGTLRLRAPGFAEPVVADRVDLTLRLPAAPHPVSGSATLVRDGRTLELTGSLDRWHQKGLSTLPEIQLDVRGDRWPWTLRAGQVTASGALDGSFDLVRRRGRWRLRGDARLLAVQAEGAPLQGDVVRLDRVAAGWDLDQEDSGWTVRRLQVAGDWGDLRAEGTLDGSGPRRITGQLNLAALARQIPRALRLREGLRVDGGTAQLELRGTAELAGATAWDAEVNLADLAARDGERRVTLRDPATISGRVVVASHGSPHVERLAVRTSFGEVSVRSRGEETGLDLTGTVELGLLRDRVGQWVNLGGLALGGRATLSGTWDLDDGGDRLNLRSEFRDLRVDGAGPSPIRSDSATLDVQVRRAKRWQEWPWSILSARVILTTPGPVARVDVTPRDQGWRIVGQGGVPVSLGAGPGRVGLDLVADWKPGRPIVTLGPSRLTLSRPGSEPPLAIVAQGEFDPSAGTLRLDPVASTDSAPLWLAAEGLRGSGIGAGLTNLHVAVQVEADLPSLGRVLGQSLPTGRGSGLFRIDGDGDGLQFAARLGGDPTTSPTNRAARASSAVIRGRFEPNADRVSLAELTVTSPFGTVDAAGQVDDLRADRRVDLAGTVAPDFAAVTSWLGSHVEAGARISGQPQPFRLRGPLGHLEGEAGVLLDSVDIYGVQLGPTPVRARMRDGTVTVDPISTTLNQGHIRLEPELGRDTGGRPILRLGKNSTIRDARINDEVSRRVLLYVAPILEDATTVTGRVSVDLDHAEIPLTAGSSSTTRLEGAVVFTDVEFAPGTLADQLLQAIGRRDARLRIDQPVTLTIADGRVNQRGLSVPIGGLTRIDLEGWVGFDRRMALTASVPVTPALLGDNAILADIAAGTRVALPISGTLDQPTIDRDALATHMKELGKDVLKRGATRGAIELLRRLSQPRDPDAPPAEPKLSPQERKARRLEKKAERRGESPP